MYALHTTDTHARSRMYCEYIVTLPEDTAAHTDIAACVASCAGRLVL